MNPEELRNPNNCETCNYKIMMTKEYRDREEYNGWCYMFSAEPIREVCFQHTARQDWTIHDFKNRFKQFFIAKELK